METENLEENARKKLQSKQCDCIIANTLSTGYSGFGTDTNEVLIISDSTSKKISGLKSTISFTLLEYFDELHKTKKAH
jgi:phosphopantothenoylcysteine decarboxylase/phosphopantothenate--cysteine ligase